LDKFNTIFEVTFDQEKHKIGRSPSIFYFKGTKHGHCLGVVPLSPIFFLFVQKVFSRWTFEIILP